MKSYSILSSHIDEFLNQLKGEGFVEDAVAFADETLQEIFLWNQIDLLDIGCLTIHDLENVDQVTLGLDQYKKLLQLHRTNDSSIVTSKNTGNDKEKNQNNNIGYEKMKVNNDDKDEDEEFEQWDDELDNYIFNENVDNLEHDDDDDDDDKNFNDATDSLEIPRKAVFFIDTLSPKNETSIKKAIHKYKFFEKVVILVLDSDAISQTLQMKHSEHYSTYSDMNERVTIWMYESHQQLKNEGLIVEESFQPMVIIRHLILNYAIVTPNLFVLPSANHIFPLLYTKKSDLPMDIGNNQTDDPQSQTDDFIRFENLPESLQAHYLQLSNLLFGVCKLCCLNPQVHYLGQTSQYVADNLQKLLKNYSASLDDIKTTFIVVDRTLDLVTPLSHSDVLLDRIFSLSKAKYRNEHGSIDIDYQMVKKNINLINSKHNSFDIIQSVKLNSLAHHFHPDILKITSQLTQSKTCKESLSFIRDTVLNLLEKEGIKINKEKMMEDGEYAKQIEYLLTLMEQNTEFPFKYAHLVQYIPILVLAINETSIEGKQQQYQELMGIEKLLLWNAAAIEQQDETKLLEQIIDLLKHPTKKYALKDIFKLLMSIYSAVSSNTNLNENDIKIELKKRMLSCNLAEENLKWLTDEMEQIISKNSTASQSALSNSSKVQPPSSSTLESQDKHKISQEEDKEEEEEEEDWDLDFDCDDDDNKVDTPGDGKDNQEESNEIDYDFVRIKHELDDRLVETFKRLKLLQDHRAHFKNFHDLLLADDLSEDSALFGTVQQPTPYQPLLRQLASKLAQNQPISDLRQYSDLLKSFTSVFGTFFQSNTAKGIIEQDCSCIVLFVIGGVAISEVIEMQREFDEAAKKSGKNLKLLIGTTSLSNLSEHIYHNVLCKDREKI